VRVWEGGSERVCGRESVEGRVRVCERESESV
jgi:hypothetical protein